MVQYSSQLIVPTSSLSVVPQNETELLTLSQGVIDSVGATILGGFVFLARAVTVSKICFRSTYFPVDNKLREMLILHSTSLKSVAPQCESVCLCVRWLVA